MKVVHLAWSLKESSYATRLIWKYPQFNHHINTLKNDVNEFNKIR